MSRNPVHTVLIPCALLALVAVVATARNWAREEAADLETAGVITGASDTGGGDGGVWTDGALAVPEHRSTTCPVAIDAAADAAPAHPALDARERVSMNSGRRL